MYSVSICTTDDRELPPPDLAPGLTWDRLVDVLRREVSPQAAALLAEPVFDAARGQTQWLVTAAEDPKPLAALPGPARDRLLASLDARRRAILAFADRLAASGSEADQRLAATLRVVIDVPDPDRHIWSAGGQPVLTAWGRRPDGAASRPATIIAHGWSARAAEAGGDLRPAAAAILATQTPVAPERPEPRPTAGIAASPASVRVWPAVLWGLLALLVAAILVLLLPACSVDLPLVNTLVNACPASTTRDLSALRARNLELRAAIRAAEMKVATLQGECAAPRRADASPTDPARGPEARDTEERRRRAQGTQGMLDITLAWNGREDLDLHVTCPTGEIWANNRNACGGSLEIDHNVMVETRGENPVEHVTWAAEPPQGDYRIVVRLFNRFELPPRDIPFTVVVREGADQRVFTNVVRELKQPVVVTEFKR